MLITRCVLLALLATTARAGILEHETVNDFFCHEVSVTVEETHAAVQKLSERLESVEETLLSIVAKQRYFANCIRHADICKNGGTCNYDDQNGQTCTCAPGWLGDSCQEADLCFEHGCKNGACEYEGDSQWCTCDYGWTGELCDEVDNVPSWRCHHWSANDVMEIQRVKEEAGMTQMEAEEHVCTAGGRADTFQFTQGQNDHNPGCGTCFCCKKEWKCYHWSESDRQRIQELGGGNSAENQVCSTELGHRFTGGEDDGTTPGCDCYCCQMNLVPAQ